MLHPSIENDLRVQLSQLAFEQQQQVLAFAQALVEQHHPAGLPGETYRSFAGSIDPEALRQMAAAIQEGCERVDVNEW